MGVEKLFVKGLTEAAESGAAKRLFDVVAEQLSGAGRALESAMMNGTTEQSALFGVSQAGVRRAGIDIADAAGNELGLTLPKPVLGEGSLSRIRTLNPDVALPLGNGLDDRSLATRGLLRQPMVFTSEGNLLPGVYKSDWTGFGSAFGFNEHRIEQLRRVEPLMRELKDAGLDEVYAGGSFITKKANPGDIDFAAILRDDHSTALWQRVDYLRDKPKSFGEHMMLGFDARGFNDTSIHTLRFNRAQQEVGIVKLRLPAVDETMKIFQR